jgi:hypothetical protein
MLLISKSLVIGMSSHPSVCYVLPTLSISRLLPRQRSSPHLIVTFSPTRKIPHNSGGSNGYEFCPD